jgi:hypothetical protein
LSIFSSSLLLLILDVLPQRVGKLAGMFVNGFQQISNIVSEVLEEVVVEGEEAEEVRSKVNQLLEQEVSRLSNDVFLDSGEAISYLHDAEKQTVIICKWMLLRWKQEEPPAPVPVPVPVPSPASSSSIPTPATPSVSTTFSESNQEEPESAILAEEKEVKEEVEEEEEATKQEEPVSTQKKEVKEEEVKKEQEGKKGGRRNRNRNGKK